MEFDKYRQSLALIGARQPGGQGLESSRRQHGGSLLATGCGYSLDASPLNDTAAQWGKSNEK